MGSIINFKCENCEFTFQDKDLIFYLDEDNKIKEETLTLENSKLMSKSLLEGFLYESYCPHCKELIKTYVPEMNHINLKKEEIYEIITKYNKNKDNKDKTNKNNKNKNNKNKNNKNKNNKNNNFKIIIFDFQETTYKDRRKVLENNECPNCMKNTSLLISENIPCPQCGNKLKEI